jgi:hypothetical protein
MSNKMKVKPLSKPKHKTNPVNKVSQKERPTHLRGKLKQTEGYTPRPALEPGTTKEGGLPKGGGRQQKAREKRLSNVPM